MDQQTKISGADLRSVEWKIARKEVKVLLVNGSRLYSEGLQLLLDRESEQQSLIFRITHNQSLEEVVNLGQQGQLHTVFTGQEIELILLSTVKANFSLTVAAGTYLRQTGSGLPVLWLDMPDDSHKILSCIRSGGAGFLMENEPPQRFYQALSQAVQGELVCPPAALGYLFEQVNLVEQLNSNASKQPGTDDEFEIELTPREREILAAIMQSLSNREIAQRLSIELRTVKNHTHNILKKLQVNNRREAIMKAIQLNLFSRRDPLIAQVHPR